MSRRRPRTTLDGMETQTLLDFLTAKWVAPSLGAVAHLGVADLVADGPRTPADLAPECGADPVALRRVLRALASVGVFAEDDTGRFGLTPVAELLRSDVPGSMRWATVAATMDPMWRPYGQILHSVRTGKPAFPEVYGMPVWEFFATHPEEAALFQQAAVGFYRQSVPPIVASYDWSRFGTLVDVGGGTGVLLAAILDANPGLRGTLFELPGVLEQAPKALAEAGVTDRVELVAGDFFVSVPAGADAYLVKSCLHAFGDADALRLLRAVRAAMKPDAVLLVVEAVLPPGNAPHYGKLSDVELLTLAGGAERTAGEWVALLEAGGFRIDRTVPAGGVVSIMEARAAGDVPTR
jgi:hypothetical protein